jgi:hypothetical protein
MRAREVGGYEPDDTEQTELHELWFMARGFAFAEKNAAELLAKHGSVRGAQLAWVVDEFLKKHDGEPHVARKWVYVWSEANLGCHVIEARSVTTKDAWGHTRVVGGFGDVGINNNNDKKGRK